MQSRRQLIQPGLAVPAQLETQPATHASIADRVAESAWDDEATIAVFSTVAALVITLIGIVCRWGIGAVAQQKLHVFIGAFGLGTLLFTARPAFSALRALRDGSMPRQLSLLHPVFGLHLPLALVALFAAFGGIAHRYAWTSHGEAAAALLLAAGLTSSSFVLRVWRHGRVTMIVGGAALLGVWLSAVVWGSGFLTPIYELKLMMGQTHVDTLFHVSIGRMMDTYGVVSTGLDGPQPIPYHFLSHWLLARLSALLECDVMTVYNLAYPIAFVPLMVWSLLSFACAASTMIHALPGNVARPLRASPLFWMVVLVGFIGVIPTEVAMQMGIWNNALRSESFLLALTTMFVALGIVASTNVRRLSGAMSKPRLTIGTMAVLLVLFGAIGLLKISVLFVLLAALGYAVVRTGNPRDVRLLAFVTASMFVLFLVHGVTRGAGGDELTIFPLHFFRNYVHPMLWPFAPFFYFFWLFAYVLLRVYLSGVRTVVSAEKHIRRRSWIDVEFAIVICVASALPGAVFYLASGNANYFSEVQRWVLFAMTVAAVLSVKRFTMNAGVKRTRDEPTPQAEAV